MFKFLKRIIHWILGIADKADDGLAKAAVFVVEKIKPVLFFPGTDIFVGIIDVLIHSKLPSKILDQLQKWVPIFLTTQGIIHSITPDSTKEEINTELQRIVKEIPGLNKLDKSKLWTTLAASIYVLMSKVDKGKEIKFADAVVIVEQAYEAYINSKK